MKENLFKRVLFSGWDSWLSYARNDVTRLFKAIFGLFYAIVFGLMSLVYHGIMGFVRLYRRYPVFFLTLLAIVLFMLWLVTYMNLSMRAKTFEHQRDSIGYEMMKIEQAFNGDTIIVCAKKKL